MSQNNEVWLKIFNNLEFVDNYKIANGTIEKVFVDNENNTWRIVLSLPEVLKLEVMEELTSKVKDFCIKEFKVKNVKFTISYLNFENFTKTNCFKAEVLKYYNQFFLIVQLRLYVPLI